MTFPVTSSGDCSDMAASVVFTSNNLQLHMRNGTEMYISSFQCVTVVPVLALVCFTKGWRVNRLTVCSWFLSFCIRSQNIGHVLNTLTLYKNVQLEVNRHLILTNGCTFLSYGACLNLFFKSNEVFCKVGVQSMTAFVHLQVDCIN